MGKGKVGRWRRYRNDKEYRDKLVALAARPEAKKRRNECARRRYRLEHRKVY